MRKKIHGISRRKKIPGIFRCFISLFRDRLSLSPEFRVYRDFSLEIFRGFHNPIPIPGISGFFTRDISGIFHSGFFRDFQIPISIPGIWDFRDFSIQPKIENPDPEAKDHMLQFYCQTHTFALGNLLTFVPVMKITHIENFFTKKFELKFSTKTQKEDPDLKIQSHMKIEFSRIF